MNFFLGLLAIGFGSLLIVYRESCADGVGEPSWATKVGGMQIVIVVVGILMCFWGLATMTGTSDIFFSPIMNVLPGVRNAPVNEGF